MICTNGGNDSWKFKEEIADKKKATIIGRFACKDYDTFGPFKLVGGIAKVA